MPAYWLGPFEQKYNAWGAEKEVTEQRYDFYLGSLVKVGYLRGRGGSTAALSRYPEAMT